MTFVARRRFTATYGGERVVIEAGERLVDEHRLAGQYPTEFDRVDDEQPRLPRPDQNGRAPTRSASGGGPRRRQMTAEEQGRIRRARLDELAARQHERPEPPDAETLFWEGVDRLLGFDRLKRQAEDDDRFLDGFNAAKARDVRAGVEGLSEWLDR